MNVCNALPEPAGGWCCGLPEGHDGPHNDLHGKLWTGWRRVQEVPTIRPSELRRAWLQAFGLGVVAGLLMAIALIALPLVFQPA